MLIELNKYQRYKGRLCIRCNKLNRKTIYWGKIALLLAADCQYTHLVPSRTVSELLVIFCRFCGKPEVTKRRFLRQMASQAKYNPGFWKAITDFLLMNTSNFCSISYHLWVTRDFSWFCGKSEVTKRHFLRQMASQVKYNPGFWKAIIDFL